MTAEFWAQAAVSVVMVAVPAAGAWAWRAQSDITTLKANEATRKDNDKEWRQEFKDRFDRLEDKIDALGRK